MNCLEAFESVAASRNANSVEALVVEDDSREYTFAQLNSLADDIAHHISSCLATKLQLHHSSTPLVSILMQRHVALVVSMLAVLKAGAAYVPVDPAFPPDRQSYIFEHSQCSLLLADKESYDAAVALGVTLPPVLVLDPNSASVINNIASVGAQATASSLVKARRKQQDREGGGLMYVLYTSGSTGKPKGVMVRHRGVANLVAWFANELRVGLGRSVLGLTTACFDISMLEIFLPLTTGGRLVLAKTASQRDPFRLLELIRKEQVSVVQATPTTYEMLLATGWRGDPSIDFLVRGRDFRIESLISS